MLESLRPQVLQKGEGDITNSQSELDSLPDTDDESQGSESDTDSEAHRSDDQQSAEDDVSTSTTGAKMENHERHSRDLDEENFKGETPSEFRSDFKNATTAIRDEVSRLQTKTRSYEGYYMIPGRSSTSCINYVVAGKRQYSNCRRRSGT